MTDDSILFILTQPPHGSSDAREGLDAILAASAVTENISVLFMGDGVWQLLKGQAPQAIEQRHIEPTYAMLELYDVDAIYIDVEALTARYIDPDKLLLEGQFVAPDAMTELFHQHRHILRF